MTGLLFVTSHTTDVKDLNRILLYLRDWEAANLASSSSTSSSRSSSPLSGTPEPPATAFLDRFRFVTTHSPKALLSHGNTRSTTASKRRRSSGGTFPPVPPSATFVNSWVGASVEEIEEFVDGVRRQQQKQQQEQQEQQQREQTLVQSKDVYTKDNKFCPAEETRDSGYSSEDCPPSPSSSSSSSSLTDDENNNDLTAKGVFDGYNTDMYLVVDEAGLASGTAILGCRRRHSDESTNSWDRVRGIPWAQVCSAWKAVEKKKKKINADDENLNDLNNNDDGVATTHAATSPVESLCVQPKKQQQRQNLDNDVGIPRWLTYKTPAKDDCSFSAALLDYRRRDLEVSMWRECGLV